MTQFGQDFQATIKRTLPNFVLAFFYRVMGCLNQNAYSQIASNIAEIEAQKQNLGKDYDKYVVPFILNAMANICFDLEKYKDAIRILDKALMWQKKMHGEKHPLLGQTLNNLAVVYAQQGKYENVKSLAEKALKIYVQPTCDNYPFVAERLGELARYFNNQGKYDEEEQCYIRALGICEAKQNSDDSLVAAAYSNELAQCYLRRDKLKKAKKLFKNTLRKACENEFGDAGDKSSRLNNKLAPKRIFKIAKNDNESFTKIWQIAEERKRNKTRASEEVSTFYTPNFEFALKGLKAIYEKQGKHVAAKALNHYANQQSVAPPLPPKRRDIVQASIIPTPPPLPSPPHLQYYQLEETDHIPHRWSISQTRLTMRSPPPPLPTRENGPAPIVSRKNIPTMRSSPPLPLPTMSPVRGIGSSHETILEGFMESSSESQAVEDESFIGSEVLQEQTRSLERIVAVLEAEITEKTQRLAEAERALETHGAFCCICLDEVANRMWSGCSHLVACSQCSERLLREEENRSDEGIACPKCRTHGHVLPAFI